jgi:hypothetical protein
MVYTLSKLREIFCLVTVDGDLRLGERIQQKAAIEAMHEVHTTLGLSGKTTWFINEIDFHWTRQHPELLVLLGQSGECIGVHDHQDTHFADQYTDAFILMEDSRSRLAEFYRSENMEIPLQAHRNGCAIQSKDYYQSSIELGYTLASDVRPEMAWYARMIKQDGQWMCLNGDDHRSIFNDNRSIPLGVKPWYHDADNWMDYTQTQGSLLQVPVISMPGVQAERVKEAVAHSSTQAFIVIDTHPYDLQDPYSGQVSPERLLSYQKSLSWITEELAPTFIRIDQVSAKLLA